MCYRDVFTELQRYYTHKPKLCFVRSALTFDLQPLTQILICSSLSPRTDILSVAASEAYKHCFSVILEN